MRKVRVTAKEGDVIRFCLCCLKDIAMMIYGAGVSSFLYIYIDLVMFTSINFLLHMTC